MTSCLDKLWLFARRNDCMYTLNKLLSFLIATALAVASSPAATGGGHCQQPLVTAPADRIRWNVRALGSGSMRPTLLECRTHGRPHAWVARAHPTYS